MTEYPTLETRHMYTGAFAPTVTGWVLVPKFGDSVLGGKHGENSDQATICITNYTLLKSNSMLAQNKPQTSNSGSQEIGFTKPNHIFTD